LEVEFFKLQGLLSFIHSEKIYSEIDEESKQKIKTSYNAILNAFSIIEERTDELSDSPKFENFRYLNFHSREIRDAKEKIKAIFAPVLVSIVEDRFFGHITGDNIPNRNSMSMGNRKLIYQFLYFDQNC
jgi:hypothetical protein